MEIGFVGIALIVGLGLIWFWNSLYIIKEWSGSGASAGTIDTRSKKRRH